MHNFLDTILEHKRSLLKQKKVFLNSIKDKLAKDKYTRYQLFQKSITQGGKISLIAEIKKSSPSKGMLREDFDVTAIAKIYAEHASAISVLTEDKFFLGKPEYVKKVSVEVQIPVLTKDFIIDEGQIYEARFMGASAILLIVAILDEHRIKEFLETAHRLDLDCLVEVHNEQELNVALNCDAEIIGINNRDLKTFEVQLNTSHDLIPKIPEGKVIVAESGIQTHQDVLTLQELGAHAVLIGETFLKEKDIGKKVKELMYG